jgi:tetratricopeptide (TPR) repeat protein
MRRSPFLPVCVVLLISAYPGFGFQMGGGGSGAGNLRVRITDTNDRAIGMQAHVQLVATGSAAVDREGYCNNEGMLDFAFVAPGTYHLIVTGEGLERTDSGTFEVDERKTTQMQYVRVQKIEDSKPVGGGVAVSVRDINVPEAASREFDQASEAMGRQDWNQAVTHLNRAVAIYPKYVEGYTNLGVVYARLGDVDKERQALMKAIDTNNHFAPAYVNLARLEIKEHNFPAAEAHLKQATLADPADVRTLALLAQVQLLDHHYEDAIANAGKVHARAHDSDALVHYVAARACERLNRLADAVNEFKLFLAEEPLGARATAAREEMAAVQKQLH